MAAPSPLPPAGAVLLSVRDAHVAYRAGVLALHGVSLEVRAGEAVALVGANGAGKTTLLKTIAGLLTPRSGEIWFDGRRIDDVEAAGPRRARHRARARGPAPLQPPLGRREPAPRHLPRPRSRSDRQEMLERVFGLFPVLRAARRTSARARSPAARARCSSIARALMSRPRFLMLDEPSLGIMPRIVDSILDVLQMLHRQEGLTVLLVEQNVPAALAAADRGYVLQTGRIVAEGGARALLDSDLVRRAYLGM